MTLLGDPDLIGRPLPDDEPQPVAPTVPRARPQAVPHPDGSPRDVVALLEQIVSRAGEWQALLAASDDLGPWVRPAAPHPAPPVIGPPPPGQTSASATASTASLSSVVSVSSVVSTRHRPLAAARPGSGLPRPVPTAPERDGIHADGTHTDGTDTDGTHAGTHSGGLYARGQVEVRAALKSVVSSATRSLLWSRRGLDATVWGGIGTVSAQTCRALDVRVLLRCDHGSIPEAARALRQTARHGGQIRVIGSDNAGLEFLAVDEGLAYLAELDDAGEPVLRELADPVLVGVLTSSFAMVWTGAVSLAEADALADVLTGAVRRAVLEMLIDGAKDEAIARTLGISLRTCRRHVAEIMAALAATSRFQAGHSLARACLNLGTTVRSDYTPTEVTA